MTWRRGTVTAGVALLSMVLASPLSANNAWGDYHWDGTSTPVPLTLENNLSPSWPSVLTAVEQDWDVSDVLTLNIGSADGSSNCGNPLANVASTDPGEIQVCNGSYGANGWLGVARIWIAADGTHITAGIAAVNDSYLGPGGAYDNANARRHVLCQEVGHAFGLDHQKGPNKRSCMNDQWGLTSSSFVSPNQHDYNQLDTIYAHLGGTPGDTGGDKGGPPCSKNPSHPNCVAGSTAGPYSVKRLANGQTLVTWITWAPGHGPR
jgi:hypothetical protein